MLLTKLITRFSVCLTATASIKVAISNAQCSSLNVIQPDWICTVQLNLRYLVSPYIYKTIIIIKYFILHLLLQKELRRIMAVNTNYIKATTDLCKVKKQIFNTSILYSLKITRIEFDPITACREKISTSNQWIRIVLLMTQYRFCGPWGFHPRSDILTANSI